MAVSVQCIAKNKNHRGAPVAQTYSMYTTPGCAATMAFLSSMVL